MKSKHLMLLVTLPLLTTTLAHAGGGPSNVTKVSCNTKQNNCRVYVADEFVCDQAGEQVTSKVIKFIMESVTDEAAIKLAISARLSGRHIDFGVDEGCPNGVLTGSWITLL